MKFHMLRNHHLNNEREREKERERENVKDEEITTFSFKTTDV